MVCIDQVLTQHSPSCDPMQLLHHCLYNVSPSFRSRSSQGDRACSLLSLKCLSLCHTVQNGAWCETHGVLDLLAVRSWCYLDLFCVELEECHIVAVHWAWNEFSPSLVYVQSCPKVIAVLSKMVPDFAVGMIWAVISTLCLYHLYRICCSDSAPGQQDGQFSLLVLLLSSPWAPFPTWLLMEFWLTVRFRLPFAECCWHIGSLQKHTVVSTAFLCPLFSRCPSAVGLFSYL